MGFFSKLFKGPEIDMEKSNANAKKMLLSFIQTKKDTLASMPMTGWKMKSCMFMYHRMMNWPLLPTSL